MEMILRKTLNTYRERKTASLRQFVFVFVFPASSQNLWGIPKLGKGFNASEKSLNQPQTENLNI